MDSKVFFLLFICCTLFGGVVSGQDINTIAGNGAASSAGDGGLANAASLFFPDGIAADANGNIFVAEYSGHRIRRISTSGIITTVAGNGIAGFSGDGGLATAAQLNFPEQIFVDVAGNLYIADGNNFRVRKVSPAGIISTVAGNGINGSTGNGGLAVNASLGFARSIVMDGLGNLFISEESNGATQAHIRKVTSTGIISNVTGTNVPGFSGDGGLATAAQISKEYIFLAMMPNGDLIFSDGANSRIRRINSATGIITTMFTTPQEMNGIACDVLGNVYLSCQSLYYIYKYTPGGLQSTIAGTGVAGFSGDGGPAIAASLSGGFDVELDAAGNIYFADYFNQRVRKINSQWAITTMPLVGPYCSGTSINVGFSSTGTFLPGNQYTVQLSNASGLFTSPIVIGSVSGVANTGIIPATIPVGTPSGTGYRIRVVSSALPVSGSDNGTNLTITNSNRLYVDANVPISGTGASWLSPLKTVSEALAIVNPSLCVHEIWIKTGIYYPMAGTNVAASRDSSFRILRDGIRIYGGFAGTETFLSDRVPGNTTYFSGNIGSLSDSTDNCFHVVTVVANPANIISGNTLFSDISITGGVANGFGTFMVNGQLLNRGEGGGLSLHGSGAGNRCNPSLAKCTSWLNYADKGGAVYCNGDNGGASSPSITNCSFNNNSAVDGGGIYSSANSGTTNPVFIACSFTDNRSSQNGGGIRLQGVMAISNTSLSSCVFVGNSSGGGGGALSMISATGVLNLVVTSCLFTNNSAVGGGGGIQAIGVGNLQIQSSSFDGNKSVISGGGVHVVNGITRITKSIFTKDSAGKGGGLMLEGSHLNLDACAFNGCTAQQGGGAILIQGNTIPDTLKNNVFVGCKDFGNLAGGGGALHLNNAAASAINNTFFADSSTTSGGAIRLSGLTGNFGYYNNIFYKTNASSGNDVFTDPGSWVVTQSNNSFSNINPQFVNESAPAGANGVLGDGDDGLKLTTCSFAVNGGINAAIIASATDIDLQQRIQQGKVDLGAYESPYGTPSVALSANAPVSSGICAGTSVTFTAIISNAGTSPVYQWKKNGTNTGTNSATYTTNSLVNGDVISLTLTPALGCLFPAISADSLTIVVTPPPLTPSSITGSSHPCAGSSQTYFTPLIAGATSYFWSLPAGWSGFSVSNSISVSVGSNPGSISVAAINLCGTSAVFSLPVIPNFLPTTPGSISGNITPCSGSQQQYKIAALANTDSYQWTVPSGGGWGAISSNDTSVNITAGSVGGNITVAGVNVCGVGAASTLMVNPLPTLTPSVTITQSDSVICIGATITFTAIDFAGGAAPTFQWYKNGIVVGGAVSQTYTPTTLANNDEIQVRLTSSYSCVSIPVVLSSKLVVLVRPTVTAGVNINTFPPTSVCAGAAILFVTNIASGGSTPKYQWYKNSLPIPGEVAPTYSTANLADLDTFMVRLISNERCVDDTEIRSNLVVVSILPVTYPVLGMKVFPGTVVNAGDPVTFTAVFSNGGAFPQFRWKLNGAYVFNGGGPVYTTTTLSDGDEVSVEMLSSDPCTAQLITKTSPLKMTVLDPAGMINNKGTDHQVRLFPNPASTHFSVMVKGDKMPLGQVNIELINNLGQIVYHTAVKPGSTSWSLDVYPGENITSGYYQVRISGANLQAVKPILISK